MAIDIAIAAIIAIRKVLDLLVHYHKVNFKHYLSEVKLHLLACSLEVGVNCSLLKAFVIVKIVVKMDLV